VTESKQIFVQMEHKKQRGAGDFVSGLNNAAISDYDQRRIRHRVSLNRYLTWNHSHIAQYPQLVSQ
jgi:hypothetical protein